MSEILRIFTDRGNKPRLSNQVKLMVGDIELGGVLDIDVHKIEPDSVVTATITVQVRLGNES